VLPGCHRVLQARTVLTGHAAPPRALIETLWNLLLDNKQFPLYTGCVFLCAHEVFLGRMELGHQKIRPLLLTSIISVAYLLTACANNPNSLFPTLTPAQAVLMAGQSVQFTASADALPVVQPVWMVNGTAGGSETLGTISSTGLYTAPTKLPGAAVQVSVLDGATGLRSEPATVQLFNPSQLTAGTVVSTSNPLVALYSLEVPEGARVQIQFGQSANYGLTTWTQPAPAAGGTVSIFVAGMRASTTYHMQGIVFLPGGTRIADSDHTFTTGALPAAVSNITVQQTSGATPAPGIELLCLDPTDGGSELTAVVTDLSGNVIWYYNIGSGEWPYPMKLLPNGHVLVVAAPATNSQGQIPAGSENLNDVREIDLAGNLINEINLQKINAGLTSIGASFQAASLHHDILPLPNGHLILLVNYNETFNNQPGLPPGTLVTGDALIDWDPEVGPVWTWSAFDHLDPSRIPYGITNGVADWTHSNALIYSADDGNIILSMRNQNWIIKINYENGAGDGSILWHLGYQGDFTLPPGQAPIEWNYGQHYPTIVSTNSAGVFDLMFFNDGNNRLVNADDVICSSPGTVACYSSVPIFQLNEYTKTAQVQWEDNLSPAYSICCGNASLLSNNDVEYDVAYNLFTPGVSYVQEVTQDASPQLEWQMNIKGPLAYRAFRIPSLYPGVEWTQTAIATSEAQVSSAQVGATSKKP
jgi:arylsulfate sulfotransferase